MWRFEDTLLKGETYSLTEEPIFSVNYNKIWQKKLNKILIYIVSY